MKIFICAFLVLRSIFCYAQQNSLDTSNKIITKTLKKNNSIGFATKLIVPFSFITYGIIAQNSKGLKQLDVSTRNTINTNHPGYHTKIDNYLQFVPSVSVYALNAFGVKGKNNFRDRTIIFAMSNIISTSIVTPLKHITKVLRPDGSSNNSFPSGHTTTAFANAEFLRQEYKEVSPWYGILGYAAAATTGSLRVYNNRHWVSDVVAGAGFGILSTKLAYWIYPTLKKHLFKNKNANALVLPFYQNGNTGFVAVYQFRK
jgi:PAP2 superfamily